MAGRRRGAGSRTSKRRGYYWDGINWPNTAIASAGTIFEVIGPTAQEFMPGTLVRVRGQVTLMNSGANKAASGISYGLKLMYVEINDAGTVTGDHQGIDTHEEDIAQRQLWARMGRLSVTDASANDASIDIEVDVKAKLKLRASGKWILALLADANADTKLEMTGGLRALIMHA